VQFYSESIVIFCIQKLFKELARQKTVLGMLVNTVKSVHPIANSNVVSHSTAFDKKLSETEELLSDLEVNASETRAVLRSRLQQVCTCVRQCYLRVVTCK